MSSKNSSLVIICTGAVLCGTIIALAQASTCPCAVKEPGVKPPRCNDGSKSTLKNDESSYASHNHDSRRLYEDCLPEVAVNEVKCFKWKIRSCEHTGEPDMCSLTARNDAEIKGLPQSIQSPKFDENVSRNKTFGQRFFCVYNVSMSTSCQSGSVDIQATERSSWPNRANPDCENYVAFYSNSSRQNPDLRYCGNDMAFRRPRTLYSNSFIAIMWSDHENNYGAFEFDVSCRNDPAPIAGSTATPATSVAATETEGSAGGDIGVIPEAAIES